MVIAENYYIYLGILLFFIGVTGVLIRRNLLIVFMCIEMMLNAVNLLLVAFSKLHQTNTMNNAQLTSYPIDPSDGQVFVFFIMVVAAAEVAVGLAIIITMYKNFQNITSDFLNRLKH